MTFCLFELSRNKDMQRKVQQEIDEVMKKAGSDGITYDLLNEMKYLECCVNESLRKYPNVPFLFRLNNKDYIIPGTDHVIEEKTTIFIPVLGLHRDPNIYEDPMTFKPERFINCPKGNPKVTSGIVYMPFGDGPR
jgi:cytochrome P450 family 6